MSGPVGRYERQGPARRPNDPHRPVVAGNRHHGPQTVLNAALAPDANHPGFRVLPVAPSPDYKNIAWAELDEPVVSRTKTSLDSNGSASSTRYPAPARVHCVCTGGCASMAAPSASILSRFEAAAAANPGCDAAARPSSSVWRSISRFPIFCPMVRRSSGSDIPLSVERSVARVPSTAVALLLSGPAPSTCAAVPAPSRATAPSPQSTRMRIPCLSRLISFPPISSRLRQ